MKKSGFIKYLVQHNGLDFHRWVFLPGMGFGETEKWWDDGKRPTPHEGLDLCLFEDRTGGICCLNTGDGIPAIHDGTVKGVIKDFLGETVIVAHDFFVDGHGNPLITLYAHTVPIHDIYINKSVKEGDIIARIAASDRMPGGMIPHVHITAGRLINGISHDQLDWVKISRREAMVLTDPFTLIEN